ncbi:phospholipase D-like domain-containing protein [Aquimarina sediminis]|uniref:phospholipase D-like domain-containing protein n=1 Tax=Aquimarina sediminis TaxID=2070536 RepID=UPI000CA000D1|nr:phospholipase D-like domain-containing protein [Aquimarina sediminis]
MIDIISTRGISYFIERIIDEAQLEIILLTPYLNISEGLFERLERADQKKISITLVYGKSELKPSEKNKLDSLANCRLLYKEGLHAKAYLNENMGILTSMNLYEYSEIKNNELGVIFSKEGENEKLYQKLTDEVNLILHNSEMRKDFLVPKEKKIDFKKNDEDSSTMLLQFLETEEIMTLREFPMPGVRLTKKYGFACFEFDIEESEILWKCKEELFPVFTEELDNYRIYWKNHNFDIYIYNGLNVSFSSEELEIKYQKRGIEFIAESLHTYLLNSYIL